MNMPVVMKKATEKNHDRVAVTPRPQDVLAERGTKANSHPGNKAYWKLILAHRMEYRDGSRRGGHQRKERIAKRVADHILNNQKGLFLTRNLEESIFWYEMEPKDYLKKIKNALREVKNIPLYLLPYSMKKHNDVYLLYQNHQRRRSDSSTGTHETKLVCSLDDPSSTFCRSQGETDSDTSSLTEYHDDEALGGDGSLSGWPGMKSIFDHSYLPSPTSRGEPEWEPYSLNDCYAGESLSNTTFWGSTSNEVIPSVIPMWHQSYCSSPSTGGETPDWEPRSSNGESFCSLTVWGSTMCHDIIHSVAPV